MDTAAIDVINVGARPRLSPQSMLIVPLGKQCTVHYSSTWVKIAIKGCDEVTCKAHLLFALADLPAKAALYNITQFNGKFGCPSCKHEGEQVHKTSM